MARDPLVSELDQEMLSIYQREMARCRKEI
jgi:hypothetical protein